MEEEKNYKNLAIILRSLIGGSHPDDRLFSLVGASKTKTDLHRTRSLTHPHFMRDGLIFDLDSMKTLYATAA